MEITLDSQIRKQKRLKFEQGQNFFNLEVLCSEFSTPEERQPFFDLASMIAETASNTDIPVRCNDSIDRYQLIPAVGPDCAKSLPRNYFMALMTANAVKAYNKDNLKSPTIVEMGLGSGLNAIAALLADPNAKVIGYEYDAEAIKFLENLDIPRYIKDRIEIRNESFLKADMTDIKADIVINENIEPSLSREPLFQAANKILPHTHEKTLFVPGGLQFYFLFFNDQGEKVRLNTTYVDFKKEIDCPIMMEYTIDEGQDTRNKLNSLMYSNQSLSCDLVYEIINHKGGVVHSQQEHNLIEEMPIGAFSFSINAKKMNKRSKYRLRVGFDYITEGIYMDKGLIIHNGLIMNFPRDVEVNFEKMTLLNHALKKLGSYLGK